MLLALLYFLGLSELWMFGMASMADLYSPRWLSTSRLTLETFQIESL
jgi:hypothetical protein